MNKQKPVTKTTFVSFLLDETGSMESIKDDTIGGFNAYVDELRSSGNDITFSLVTFNSSKTQKRYVAEPIGRIRPLTENDYRPNAMTPLIDACVKTIKATAEAVAKRGDDPAVVIAIQTDGQENVSVEYGAADLALLVKEKEAAGWQFTFLGAGLDAFDVARQAGLNIDAGQVIAYDRARSREVFAVHAQNVSKFAATGDAVNLKYSNAQRDRVGDKYSRRDPDPQAPADAEPAAAPVSKSAGDQGVKSAGKKSRKADSSVDDFAL